MRLQTTLPGVSLCPISNDSWRWNTNKSVNGARVEERLRRKIEAFVRENIVAFHRWRSNSVDLISLKTLINNKNPYLFRAKNLNVAADLVEAVLSARLSSSEEGVFGKFLEDLATFVAETTGHGQKSGIEGIDIEVPRNGVRHLIAVKSGRKWGNAQSKAKQKQDFRRAIQVIKQSKHAGEVVAVLGICYGNFRTKHTGEYLHIGGQSFWHLLSGDPNLYVDIVDPLGHEAQRHDDEFQQHLGNLKDRLTKELADRYCHSNGAIDWPKLVKAVSGNMNSEDG